MKKIKMPISPALLKSEEKLARETNLRMAMSEAERFKDEKCRRLAPCCICKAEDDVIRKPFVPVDVVLKMKVRHTAVTVCICAKCLCKLFEGDLIQQIVSEKELRELLV